MLVVVEENRTWGAGPALSLLTDSADTACWQTSKREAVHVMLSNLMFYYVTYMYR